MRIRTITEYTLATLVVLTLGALSGWYFFLHIQTQPTIVIGAPGSNSSPTVGEGHTNGENVPVGQASGTSSPAARPGVFSRIWNIITHDETGVSESSLPSFDQNQSESTSTDVVSQAGNLPQKSATKLPPQLWHLETKPVAGIGFVKSGGSERLRYVERATGYVYEADVETGVVTRITNVLTPKIYEAIPTAQGRIIQRSLDETGRISTSIGAIGTSVSTTTIGTTSAQTLSSIALPKDITRIATDPRSGALFYLVNDASGALKDCDSLSRVLARCESGVGGFRSEWNGAKPKRIFGSVIMNWRPTWLSDGRIILVQAAADSVPGYAYELESTGVLTPLLRAIPGLTLLPRPASGGASTRGAMLYGQSNAGVLTLFAQVSPNATPTKLPIKTIADKCVWVPDLSAQSAGTNRNPVRTPGKELVAYCAVPQGLVSQNFLNDWYRGALHSVDAMWRVDAGAGSAELLYTPETGTSIDVENPTLDSTGSYIAFMNNNDESLWILRLNK